MIMVMIYNDCIYLISYSVSHLLPPATAAECLPGRTRARKGEKRERERETERDAKCKDR